MGGTEPAGRRYLRLTLVPTAGSSGTGSVPERIGVLAGSPAEPRHPPAVGLHGALRGAGMPSDQLVDVEEAVEVTGLVLKHPSKQSVALQGDGCAVGIESRDAGPA